MYFLVNQLIKYKPAQVGVQVDPQSIPRPSPSSKTFLPTAHYLDSLIHSLASVYLQHERVVIVFSVLQFVQSSLTLDSMISCLTKTSSSTHPSYHHIKKGNQQIKMKNQKIITIHINHYWGLQLYLVSIDHL
jgi:hypothetical protein